MIARGFVGHTSLFWNDVQGSLGVALHSTQLPSFNAHLHSRPVAALQRKRGQRQDPSLPVLVTGVRRNDLCRSSAKYRPQQTSLRPSKTLRAFYKLVSVIHATQAPFSVAFLVSAWMVMTILTQTGRRRFTFAKPQGRQMFGLLKLVD